MAAAPPRPDALKRNVLEPFVRGDDARNMDEAAGFGLGLSISNAIVLAHGGALSLHDRQPHGLVSGCDCRRTRAAAAPPPRS